MPERGEGGKKWEEVKEREQLGKKGGGRKGGRATSETDSEKERGSGRKH